MGLAIGHVTRHLIGARNRVLYGGDVPFSYERIWVNPQEVIHTVKRSSPEFGRFFTRSKSGLILDGNWHAEVMPLEANQKYNACKQHFIDGAPWSETGIYERMMRTINEKGSFDSCKNLDDVIARYENMDTLWASLRDKGFQPVQPASKTRATERGGVFVHIGPQGQPIFGLIGNHRFAMSRLMGLTQIPAQLGLIHADAYKAGVLEAYRHPKMDSAKTL